jgi:sugar/nucleoside kinase (ribokinase family)
MTHTKRVLGIGTPTVDRLIKVPGPPGFGSGTLVQNLGQQGGGPVPTALVAARRLGVEAALATRLGDDEVGRQIEAGLASERIDLRMVQKSRSSRSASSTILVDAQGERAILYDPGENTDPEITDALLDAVRDVDGVLLDRCTAASIAVAKASRDSGAVMQLDAGGYDDRVMELAPYCDIVIGSAYHAEARGSSPGDAIDELLALGVNAVVMTLGPNGAVGRQRDSEEITIPAYPVEAVDTTGAGDVYHGAFLAAWLSSHSLLGSMRLAAVVAALKCQQPGGRAGIPYRDEAYRHLESW